MELKIIWTQTAKSNLVEIYNYYKFTVSQRIAYSIISKIKTNVNSLSNFPTSGIKQDILKGTNKEYRYIIVNNYKIIYEIQKNYIFIITIFDTRQNPDKLNTITL